METIIHNNKTLYFIATAHVSKHSVIEVEETIRTIKPEAVCVELDAGRAQNLQSKETYRQMDIRQIIKQKKVGMFLANLILSSFQKEIADDLGTQVGQEMKQAIDSAQQEQATIHYIDRDVQITMMRIWRNLSFFKKINLAATLFASLFESKEITESDIEKLKESDLLLESIKELEDKYPEITNNLLHERNAYMAEKIKAIAANTIVVVIGAAHKEGIIAALDQDHDLQTLETIPEKKKNSWAGWIVPGILVALLAILTFKNPQTGLNQLVMWLGLSSGLAAFGALIARAHPLTVLCALLSAPIGTLSPFLAVGFFAGTVEAMQRPPQVSDFETLAIDFKSLRKWYSNKVLRILLIVILTNALSSIGTFVAGGSIISSLFGN